MAGREEFKCFVANLDYSVDSQMLLEYFESCGATNAKVERDQRSGKSSGFGHVYFATKEAAQEAVILMNDTTLEGTKISVHALATPERAITPAGNTTGGRRHTRRQSASMGSPAPTHARMPSTGRRGFSLGSKYFEARDAGAGGPLMIPKEPVTTGSRSQLEGQKSWSFLSLLKETKPVQSTKPKKIFRTQSEAAGPKSAIQPQEVAKKALKNKDRPKGPVKSQSEGPRFPKSQSEAPK